MKHSYSVLALAASVLVIEACSGSAVEDASVVLQRKTAPAQQENQRPDTIVSFATHAANVKLFWKDDDGRILGSLSRLNAFAEQSGDTVRFAMNGGMYTEDQQPLGLFIAEGKTIRRVNRDTGYGNFYLRPNGVFCVTKEGKAIVCRTHDLPSEKSIRWATQSGPMLLTDGRFHPAFKQGSANVNIRNGVGILPNGQALFAITSTPVNLYDFAAFFKKQGCKNALYLDGFVSRVYYPEQGLTDKGGAFGVMIGVVQ
jgi:uncharacterized protein YigE (DUF2233 family)